MGVVRERVAVAERGAWGQLVHMMYTEICFWCWRRAASPGIAGPGSVDSFGKGAQGEPIWDERTLERAAYRGRIGSPKGATNI